jgi:hypothetical protein
MVAEPQWLNTWQDYLNIRDDYPDLLRNGLQDLLDNSYAWLTIGPLTEDEAGVTDDTHEIRVDELPEGGAQRYQFEYAEDPAAKIFRLRVTVDEVTRLLESLPQ